MHTLRCNVARRPKNGHGVMLFDGDTYEGEWRDDAANGHFVVTYRMAITSKASGEMASRSNEYRVFPLGEETLFDNGSPSHLTGWPSLKFSRAPRRPTVKCYKPNKNRLFRTPQHTRNRPALNIMLMTIAYPQLWMARTLAKRGGLFVVLRPSGTSEILQRTDCA